MFENNNLPEKLSVGINDAEILYDGRVFKKAEVGYEKDGQSDFFIKNISADRRLIKLVKERHALIAKKSTGETGRPWFPLADEVSAL